MNREQRQMFILVVLMVFLSSAFLFLFVYAPDPLQAPSVTIPIPEPLESGINATVQGYEALFSDLESTGGFLSSGK